MGGRSDPFPKASASLVIASAEDGAVAAEAGRCMEAGVVMV